MAKNDDDAVRALRQHIDSLDALLLVPDDTLINAWSLKPILLMTARHFLPVFGGPTDHFVKAGVTAARIPDFGGLIGDIKRILHQFAQGTIPLPQYPSTLRTEVNEWVARALSIDTERLLHSDER